MTKSINEYNDIVFEGHIVEYMQQFVKGQEKALDLMAYIGHLYTVNLYAKSLGHDNRDLPKINLMLTGATGFGKTFMIRKLAEALGLPYARIDCSSITAEGWKGNNLSSEIAKYVGSTVNGAGIIHLDEFDKIGNNTGHDGDNTRDYNLALQQCLLDLLDGDYSGEAENRKLPLDQANNALVIISGSFQTARNNELKKHKIGFNTADDAKLDSKETWKDNLIQSGFMHEFASRIVISTELEKYNEDQIRQIIVEGKQSAYNKFKRVLGIEAELEGVELEQVIKVISESKNGLRDLDSLLFDKYYKRKRGIS